MTWRAIWGESFPEWSDHATEAEAHRFALRKSRDEGCEVAVVPLEGAKTGPGSRSDDLDVVGEGGWTLKDLAPLQRAINETVRRLAEVTETYTFPPQTKRGAERRAEGEA